MKDPLSEFKGKEGGGLFVKFVPDEPVKLRVLTNDPLVSVDKWGNTRYSFVVWNHNENKPQVLSKGMSILKQLQGLHIDDEWGGDVRKIDVKITSTGEGMETRYNVTPLPNSKPLTNEQIKEAASVKLEEVIGNGIRLSDANEGTPVPEPEFTEDGSGYDSARSQADKLRDTKDTVVTDFNDDDPIDLSTIPF